MQKLLCALWALAIISSITSSPSFAQSNDGRLFDPGVLMTEPAAGAPAELATMQPIVGQWDVDYRSFRADTVYEHGAGSSSITFMNRGHAIMERWYCTGCGADGLDLSSMSFLAFNSVAGYWNLGVVEGHTESVSVSSGSRSDDSLILHNAIRHGGGTTLTYYRTTYSPAAEGFNIVVETSTDYQATWDISVEKTYTPRPYDPDFLKPRADFGKPNSERDESAAQFDFLIGTYAAQQQLTFPNGQTANFPSTATAVYALNGNGILEFNWYDVDQRLPDAATSILRVYNRTLRRWESLYMTNRGNGALFFGGVKEGDDIVLGLFDTSLGSGPIRRFVFHDVKKDSYHWYADSSTDRGETFTKTWIIDFERTELD